MHLVIITIIVYYRFKEKNIQKNFCAHVKVYNNEPTNSYKCTHIKECDNIISAEIIIMYVYYHIKYREDIYVTCFK